MRLAGVLLVARYFLPNAYGSSGSETNEDPDREPWPVGPEHGVHGSLFTFSVGFTSVRGP